MSNPTNRRKFLRSGAGLFGLAWIGLSSFDLRRLTGDATDAGKDGATITGKDAGSFAGEGWASPAQRLSFSTLGCPDWSFTEILDFAVRQGYQGIEFRGIKRQLDLSQCPEFSNAENILSTRKRIADKGLSVVDLGSSATLHSLDDGIWRSNLDDAKRFIDLAEQLQCPFVRVFPNLLPKEQQKDAVLDRIAKGLLELGDHAKGSMVSVLVESHGDLLWIADLKKVMEAARHPHTGMIWDVYNMWSVTKERPEQAWAELKDYIRHTHIKDGLMIDGKERFTLLGKGESPIREAVATLVKGGYTGFYSFEWEKMWHPEIEAPEIALADYPKTMTEWFSQVGAK